MPRPSADAREAEVLAVDWLQALGLYAVDHPNTPTFSLTGHGVEPDLGFRVGHGAGSFTTTDGVIDVLGEVKVQSVAGTAIEKLTETIDRYGQLFDEHGVPAIIFHDLSVEAVGTETIADLEQLASDNLVGFVRIGAVDRGELVAIVRDLLDRRTRVPADDMMADLLASLGREGVAALARYARRTKPAAAAPEVAALFW